MLKKTQESREIEIYIDVHGHSRKSNVFMYGCGTQNKGTLTRNNEKIFPFLFSKQTKHFEFSDCNFGIHKDKESTGRVVVCKDLLVQNSFTLESSFCGPQNGEYADCHFTPDQLSLIGEDFCRTLMVYHDKDERMKAKLEISLKFPQAKEKSDN